MTTITREELEASNGSSIIGFIGAGTGAAQRTVQDKTREIISVEDFGAVGYVGLPDEVAVNNRAAIQAAIDYAASLFGFQSRGAVVYFPPGKTYLTGQLLLKSGVTLFGGRLGGKGGGLGYGGATLKPYVDSLDDDAFLITQDPEDDTLIGPGLVGLNLIGDGAESKTGGVRLFDCDTARIYSCHIFNWGIEGLRNEKGEETSSTILQMDRTLVEGLKNLSHVVARGVPSGASDIQGADHTITNCEFSGPLGPIPDEVSSGSIHCAALKADCDVSRFSKCIMQTGDVGQSHFGRNSIYSGCRWDSNAAHGIHGLNGSDNVFEGSLVGRNNVAQTEIYHHINVPETGMGRNLWDGISFYEGEIDGEMASPNHWISDARPAGDFANSYADCLGELGEDRAFNITGGSTVRMRHENVLALPTGATPSVLNGSAFLCANSGATTITDFADGVNGQRIILFGDGNTTIAAGANIVLATGTGAMLMRPNVQAEFVRQSGVWKQLGGEDQYIEAFVSEDPASIADGGSLSWTETVTGAAVYDTVTVAPGSTLSGLGLTAYVSATNTVTLTLLNNTAAPVDLLSTNFIILVRKR